MKNESITLTANESHAALVCEKAGAAGAVPIEAVGRALGYTKREFAVASDILDRFAWRSTKKLSGTNQDATEVEAIDSAREDAA